MNDIHGDLWYRVVCNGRCTQARHYSAGTAPRLLAQMALGWSVDHLKASSGSSPDLPGCAPDSYAGNEDTCE
ncbi:hypothetical protein BD310DRAFT_950834 [Dichomitus squalens]|uniref:Uncharacterized protein n=1 Tax=Dichomitus squalens TaxID=114155 RepID=A0A4V2K7E9_9APHY|nr:hypothetical protein BD310DRAFT_950834 [Dichomitus squalens]